MDNGYHNQSDVLNLDKYRTNDSFIDRQNTNLKVERTKLIEIRINEVNLRQEQIDGSDISRVTEEIDNSSSVVCGICSTGYRLNFDNEKNTNTRRTKPIEEETNFLSVLHDNGRLFLCQKCAKLSANRCEKFVMMKSKSCANAGDVDTVAMETDNGSVVCKNDNNIVATSANTNSRLMSNENILDHLKGMSLSDRRMSITPRITLTNVDDEGSGQQRLDEEAMITDDDNCCPSPLSPRFLTVPKIEELGPERRPPQLVKTM
ncbi:hypothetical protein CHUAL_002865 [Chamberlinius hualienensis]